MKIYCEHCEGYRREYIDGHVLYPEFDEWGESIPQSVACPFCDGTGYIQLPKRGERRNKTRCVIKRRMRDHEKLRPWGSDIKFPHFFHKSKSIHSYKDDYYRFDKSYLMYKSDKKDAVLQVMDCEYDVNPQLIRIKV